MDDRQFPLNGTTIYGKFKGSEVEVYGWQDSVNMEVWDSGKMEEITLTFEQARALAAQLIAAADHAEGRDA